VMCQSDNYFEKYEDFKRLPEPDQFKREVLASLERIKQPERL
jgi:hypothetical protein